MGMFGNKSVLDMSKAEFEEWRAAIERQRENEREFREATARVVTECHARGIGSGIAGKIISGGF